jgi:hypothetical protein
LKANTPYSIKISFLGMQSKEVTIVTLSDNIIKTIVLEEGGIGLDGVEIVRKCQSLLKEILLYIMLILLKQGQKRS